MAVTTNGLKESIKALSKDFQQEQILDIVLNEMNDVQLETVIQVLLNPNYHNEEAALTNPKRFVTNGEVDMTTVSTKKGSTNNLAFIPKKLEKPFDMDMATLRENLNNPVITAEEVQEVETIKESLLSQNGILPKEEK